MCAGSVCRIEVAISSEYSIARNLYELVVSLPIQCPPTTPLSCEFSKAMLRCGQNNAECCYLALKLVGAEIAWSLAITGLQAATDPEASG